MRHWAIAEMIGVRALRVLATLVVFALVGAGNADAATPVNVPLGGQKILNLAQSVERVALGNPKVAQVQVLSSKQLRVLGKAPGKTDLTVWYSDSGKSGAYSIRVGADTGDLQGALKKDKRLSGVRVVQGGEGVALKGQVYSLDDRQRAASLAKTYLGKDADNQIQVADRRMVAVQIRFAAVSVNTLKALGINFQTLGNDFQFASTVPNTVESYSVGTRGVSVTAGLPLSQAFNLFLSGSNGDLFGVISALDSANLAQMLAEPTLLVRSGEEADFLAGGEIPIPVPQSGSGNNTVTIEYKRFGVQLGVNATVLDNDRIVLKVAPEVSELDYSNGVEIQGFRIPALRSRSTRTTIELGDGQSFVLAGLMYSSSTNVEDKVPGLGDLPIIGQFFRTTQNSRERQELIIVATPRLVSPMEAGTMPKLPGEGVPPYDPSLEQRLLNTTTLDDHIVKHGLMR